MTVGEDDLAKLRDRLTLEQKVRLLTGQDFWSLPPEPAIGLRSLVMSDGPAGVRGNSWSELSPSASFPAPSALAASWDVDLIHSVAGMLAFEARRQGVDVVLAPTVNLHRSPFGGRHFEGYSEDPLLSGVLGTAYVRGLQDRGVGATAKHYVANESETDRFTVDIRADERTLRELYLAPFEQMVTEGGAWLVMAAYNGVNGATMTESPLLATPLKDEWAFDGVVVSDWFATKSTVPSGAAALDVVMPGPSGPWGDALVVAVRDGSVPESIVDDKVLRVLRLAARVGALDGTESVAVPSIPPAELATGLRSAAAAGMVLLHNAGGLLPLPPDVGTVAVIGQLADEARVQGGGSAGVVPDHVVSPLAGLRAALGDRIRYEVGVRPRERVVPMPVDLATNSAGEPGLDVRWVAEDGSVLRHERRRSGRLVWHGDGQLGASTVRVSCRFRADAAGEWRFGVSAAGRVELDLAGVTVLDEELVNRTSGGLGGAPEVSVTRTLAEGAEVDVELRFHTHPESAFANLTLGVDRPHREPEVDLAAAVGLARSSDVAVVVVGTTEQVESEGYDRRTLVLPGGQDELVRAVTEANPRTVVVLNVGAPVLLPWRDDVGALVLSWFGGQEVGDALADVLTGAREPGGRLPTTWPQIEDGVLTTTPTDGALAYTEGVRLGYRTGAVGAYPFGHGVGYTTWEYLSLDAVPDGFAVRLRNTGSRAGKEVVQVYGSRVDSAVARPVRWLVGFATVTAQPGEEVTATVAVAPRAWQHWDSGWRTEPGTFTVSAGGSSVHLPLHTDLTLR
ncbi:MAG TPA: glycoside hydrolase family 3 C-terminal domain-containing protein [Pseudonocardiaceae bacterium]|nr:glycoside hydrolase family 3 C-terminal domain-containing protein [Pseudonocardiaceae bacterium]